MKRVHYTELVVSNVLVMYWLADHRICPEPWRQVLLEPRSWNCAKSVPTLKVLPNMPRIQRKPLKVLETLLEEERERLYGNVGICPNVIQDRTSFEVEVMVSW